MYKTPTSKQSAGLSSRWFAHIANTGIPSHALFDRNTASNHWTTRALFLKEFSEYFGAKAEQLDMYLEDDKVTFLSFTDKIVNSKNGRFHYEQDYRLLILP